MQEKCAWRAQTRRSAKQPHQKEQVSGEFLTVNPSLYGSSSSVSLRDSFTDVLLVYKSGEVVVEMNVSCYFRVSWLFLRR